MCFVRLKSSTLHDIDTPPNLVKDRLVTWLLQSGMDYVLTWTFTHYWCLQMPSENSRFQIAAQHSTPCQPSASASDSVSLLNVHML